MEKFGISFSLFQPSDSRFLLPVYLLLLSSFFKLIVDALLLFEGSLCMAACTYFSLQILQGFLKIILRLEDASEGLSVPSLETKL